MLNQFVQPPKPGQAHGKPFKTNKKLSKDKVKVKGTVCGDKKRKIRSHWPKLAMAWS